MSIAVSSPTLDSFGIALQHVVISVSTHLLFILFVFGLNHGHHFEGLLLVQKVWSGIQRAWAYIVVRLVGSAMPTGTVVQSIFPYRMSQ